MPAEVSLGIKSRLLKLLGRLMLKDDTRCYQMLLFTLSYFFEDFFKYLLGREGNPSKMTLTAEQLDWLLGQEKEITLSIQELKDRSNWDHFGVFENKKLSDISNGPGNPEIFCFREEFDRKTRRYREAGKSKH